MLEPLNSHILTAAPGISHGFFTRSGGVSSGLYGSLNCGLGSHDVRAAVLENRRRVATHLGTDILLTSYQIHSARAVLVEQPWGPDDQPKADALVTRTRGLALGALAADCAPVLFADPAAGIVAAAHAGWKGALGGIIEATVLCMEQAGARRADIIASVGPCIGQAAYEVGPEFKATFLAADARNTAFFATSEARAKPHFELAGFVMNRLREARVGCLDNASVCTYSNEERFFSYRRTTHRQEADYGRHISAIALV